MLHPDHFQELSSIYLLHRSRVDSQRRLFQLFWAHGSACVHVRNIISNRYAHAHAHVHAHVHVQTQ